MAYTCYCRGATDVGRDITTMQRRNLLLGLGSATAASALLGSGAVTELTAERGIAIQVAQDAQGLLALTGISDSTNSTQFFDGGNDPSSALIDIGATNNGGSNTNAKGINYNSEAHYDDVFQLENRAENALDVSLPVGNDNTIQNVDGFNVDLYEGERATAGAIELLDQNSPLSLQVGESKNIGVRVQVPPRGDLADQNVQTINGDISLTADTRETRVENAGGSADISYQNNSPRVASSASAGSADSLNLDFTFTTVNDEEAQSILVQFNGDALVEESSSGSVAGFIDGDSINVGNSLDVSSVKEVNRNDDDSGGDERTAQGPGGSDSAEIRINLQDPVVSQSDSPDTVLNAFKVDLEADSSPNTDVNVQLEDSSKDVIAQTEFQTLQ